LFFLSFIAGGLFRTLTASLWPRAPRLGFVPASTRNDGGKTMGQDEEGAMKEDDLNRLAWPIHLSATALTFRFHAPDLITSESGEIPARFFHPPVIIFSSERRVL
jgi:hypothetical protein